MAKHSFYAIIVAGGNGSRMGSEIPKQFLELNGSCVLMHTISAFYTNEYHPKIILVLAERDLELWKRLIQKHHFKIPHEIIIGGAQRFHSVKKGLSLVTPLNAIVAIHDAVRPLVSQQTISNCFQSAIKKGNAVAAVPTKDSIRRMIGGKSKAIDRTEIYLVQTPQTFQLSQLTHGYQQEFQTSFTDDASVVEKVGYEINLEKSDEFNFKITFKEDLSLAEIILQRRLED